MFTSQVPLDLGCFARVPAKHEDSCPDNNHNLLLSARQHHSISAVGSKHKDTTSETYSRTVETLALTRNVELERDRRVRDERRRRQVDAVAQRGGDVAEPVLQRRQQNLFTDRPRSFCSISFCAHRYTRMWTHKLPNKKDI